MLLEDFLDTSLFVTSDVTNLILDSINLGASLLLNFLTNLLEIISLCEPSGGCRNSEHFVYCTLGTFNF